MIQSSARFDRQDLLLLLLLFVTATLLHLPSIGLLEFFRHTEADRSLIAWEMVESGNYLIPHLLHSTILTKPPLFYWLVALSINYFGTATEWVLRFPSVVITVLFTLTQYLATRLAGGNHGVSFLSAIILCSGFSVFTLGTVAEIDMTYGFFCALSLYSLYFSLLNASLLWTCSAYLFAAVAFLTKGPQIIFFFAATYFCFFLLGRLKPRLVSLASTVCSLPRLFLWNILGVLIFMSVVGTWLLMLAEQVGWDILAEQLRVEVFERVVAEARQPRGPFYYLGVLISGLVPWSIFLLAGIFLFFRRAWGFERSSVSTSTVSISTGQLPRTFFYFNWIVLGTALLMLSISAGKSSRYLFPVHVFAANLTLYAILSLEGSKLTQLLFKFGSYLFSCLLFVTFFLPFFLELDGVSPARIVIGSVLLGLAFAYLFYACWFQFGKSALAGLFVLVLVLRAGEMIVFTPHRNFTRSVRPIVERIHALVPQGVPIYNIELFERWVNFYLKHLGRESYRLTREEAGNPFQHRGVSYLLLHEAEEGWRLRFLSWYDPQVKVLDSYTLGRDVLLLVSVSPEVLKYLEPQEYFPTVPSPPFYNVEYSFCPNPVFIHL